LSRLDTPTSLNHQYYRPIGRANEGKLGNMGKPARVQPQ